jgi:hypothetical protein
VSHKLRQIAGPFVVAAPTGSRVRTRIVADATDVVVLRMLGAHLGRLASADMARRCREGSLDARGRADSRRGRKRDLTAESSSRRAGAITRAIEDGYQLAQRNLEANVCSLKARVRMIGTRLSAPVGARQGKTFGSRKVAERWEKQPRIQILQHRLVVAEDRLAGGLMSVCRGGRRLASNRHHLEVTDQSLAQWRAEWESERWFICADGERAKEWGNETIRWHPADGWAEIKLPGKLAHLANRPHGRYRLSAPVAWPYRGDQVAAQAASGAVRYDISFNPLRRRWYLDASWKRADPPIAGLEELRQGPVVSVDLNVGHLAVAVLDGYGNTIAKPITIPTMAVHGLSASTRDARVRQAISEVLAIAERHQAGAVVIEDLDFDRARIEGRERTGPRPARGRRGRGFPRAVLGADWQAARPARPDGIQPWVGGDRRRPRLHLEMGSRALARPPTAAAPRSNPFRSQRRYGGDRETRARTASTATGKVCLKPTGGWATESYRLRPVGHAGDHWPVQAAEH